MNKQTEEKNQQFRNVRFTIWQEEVDRIISGDELVKKMEKLEYVKFATFQLEKGATTGKLHYQGFAKIERKYRTELERDFGTKDIAKALATDEENIEYVNKEATRISGPWSFGSFKEIKKSQKTKVDYKWEDIYDRAKEGQSFNQIKEEYPSLATIHRSKILQIIDEEQPIKIADEKKRVISIFGGSGAGKTTAAKQQLLKHYKEEEILTKKASNRNWKKIWFSPEDRNKKALILEEVRFGHPDHYELLSLFDGNDKLETKGGSIPNNFEIIMVLSISPLHEIYKTLEVLEDQRQLLRRVDKSYEVIRNKVQLAVLNKMDLSEKEFQKNYKPFLFDKSNQLQSYLAELSIIIEEQEFEIAKLKSSQSDLVDKIELYRHKDTRELANLQEQLTNLRKMVEEQEKKLKK